MKPTMVLAASLICISVASAQSPSGFFPHHSGDMWEYFQLDGAGNDTLQVRVVFDSTDPGGIAYVRHHRQSLNPIGPPRVPWYEEFEVDTAGNVFALGWLSPRGLLYKLNAPIRQIWIVRGTSSGGDIARIQNRYATTVFGLPTTVMEIRYYGTQDTSDTTIWLCQYEEVLAEGFGTIFRGGGDLGYNLYLRGCVIDGATYGDTTLVSVNQNRLETSLNQSETFQNYPNPFNPTTVIRYSVAEPTHVSLRVFNILGREVRTLVDENQLTGWYEVPFDAIPLSSGLYFYRLQTPQYTATRKMLMLR